MEKIHMYWQVCRERLHRLWLVACRPWLTRRNIPYFLLLALVAFLVTTSLTGQRQREPRMSPVVTKTTAPADEPRLRLGQSDEETSAIWRGMTAQDAPGSAPAVHVDPAAFVLPGRGRLVQGRGWRRDEQSGLWTYHGGVDLQLEPGQEVRVIAPGTVAQVTGCDEGGCLVEIDHGDGWRSLYGRLALVNARSGQEITAGQALGRAENGLLHLEIRRDGSSLDPSAILPGLGAT